MSNSEVHSFVEFKLARPIIKALNELGFITPTPIQARAIPQIMDGHDVCATAITGSGKSAAFLIPIIHGLIAYRGQPGPKALIMCPTRELTNQLYDTFESLTKYAHVSGAKVTGGLSAEAQAELLVPPPDVIIATPGRIIDQLFNANTITATHIKYFVLDEADRLLSRSFESQLNAINSKLPEKHQTLLFTATLSDQVAKLVNRVQKDSVRLTVDPYMELSPNLTQQFIKVKTEEKRLPILISLCKNLCKNKTIVFFPTKQLCHRCFLLFNYAKMHAAELHADMPMPDRTASIEEFKHDKVKILLASDLAARGLDIPDIEFVVNYTIPNEIERYIHRVGRTARNGKSGTSISLVHEAHEKQIRRKITKKSESVNNMVIPPELLHAANELIKKFNDKIEKDLQKEEEERLKRCELAAERRAKQLLDVEEEILPAKDTDPKKKKKRNDDSD